MKKFVSIFSLIAVILIAGCSNNESTGTDTQADGLNILASTTMIGDLVEEVGGEHVTVEVLMAPGVDPHGYTASSSDIEKITNADVIAHNGLHLEANMVDVFEESASAGNPTIVMADAISEEQYLTSEEDSAESDPHIWFSVPIWMNAAQHVADELAAVDTDNADAYQTNAEAYISELEELDGYIRDRVAEVPEEQRYLVTAHDAFQYFGDEYDFEVVGIQGINTQTEAGTGDISSLADFIVEQNINAVFVESSVSSRNIDALIEAVSAQGHEVALGGELYSDSLGTAEEGTDTYISMYRSNIDTIVDGLK